MVFGENSMTKIRPIERILKDVKVGDLVRFLGTNPIPPHNVREITRYIANIPDQTRIEISDGFPKPMTSYGTLYPSGHLASMGTPDGRCMEISHYQIVKRAEYLSKNTLKFP